MLNHFKKLVLRSVFQFLYHCINGFPILKVNMIVWVFGLAISMALKLISIKTLHKIFNWPVRT